MRKPLEYTQRDRSGRWAPSYADEPSGRAMGGADRSATVDIGGSLGPTSGAIAWPSPGAATVVASRAHRGQHDRDPWNGGTEIREGARRLPEELRRGQRDRRGVLGLPPRREGRGPLGRHRRRRHGRRHGTKTRSCSSSRPPRAPLRSAPTSWPRKDARRRRARGRVLARVRRQRQGEPFPSAISCRIKPVWHGSTAR